MARIVLDRNMRILGDNPTLIVLRILGLLFEVLRSCCGDIDVHVLAESRTAVIRLIYGAVVLAVVGPAGLYLSDRDIPATQTSPPMTATKPPSTMNRPMSLRYPSPSIPSPKTPATAADRSRSTAVLLSP
jgi:hypothetical protein